jgi:cardiolipin synthase
MAQGARGTVSPMKRPFNSRVRALGAVALCMLLASCASVPFVRNAQELRPRALHFRGSHGVLSTQQETELLERLRVQAPDADVLRRHLAIETAVAGEPLYSGNAVTILRDGAQTFPAMFAAIRAARRSLLLEYYIFEDVESNGEHLVDLLVAKRAEGVEIAVLYDSVGSLGTPDSFFDSLRAAGVQLLAFNPVNPLKSRGHWSLNDRDHRKILVSDHQVAIVGGINLSVTYQSRRSGSAGSHSKSPEPLRWRDTDVRISGPAVAELERLFRAHWQEQSGPALPAADPSTLVADGEEVVDIIGSSPNAPAPRYYATVLSAIDTAESGIWITAAYFVPTQQEKQALIAAARRGVDVRLLVPSKSDSPPAIAIQRASYSGLLASGVRIYERDDVILHSKCVLVDGVWSVVGSSNFDYRSVLYNDEVDAVVVGRQTARQLEQLFQTDVGPAQQIDLQAWKHRSIGERARELFWRAWSSLL